MKRFALKDVNPRAMTLCKQGANRQRIFLRKEAGDPEPTIALRPGPILKQAEGDDWSVFYCVVAEPGAEEDPGQTGDRDSVDVWVDPDEIRKACHRLAKNQAYVNASHDDDPLEGCHIVENAIALTDLHIESPDGDVETIKKDSWYIAIEPDADHKALIDAGEIEAISLEGDGLRVALEKSGGAPLGNSVVHVHNGAGGDVGLLRKLWAQLTSDPLPAELSKSADFAEVIGERELTDSLWRAWSALEGVIFDAFRSEDEPDPKGVITRSLGQFQEYLLGKLEALPADERMGLAKDLGTLNGNTDLGDEPMGLKEDFESFKKDNEDALSQIRKDGEATTQAVTGLTGLVEKLIDRLDGKGGEGDGDGNGATQVKKSNDEIVQMLGKLADKQDEMDSDLTAIAKAIVEQSGGSTQPAGGDTPLRKTENDNPLAGLLA